MKWTIYKYNPKTDTEPTYVTGEVPFTENMTALHALMYFDENIEHINYDHSCRSRVCGRCAMDLNGLPQMICVAKLEDKDYTLEPLTGFPVVRDLVVDKHAFYDRITSISRRVCIEPFTTETIKADPATYTEDALWQTYGYEECCRCGCCTAACPAYQMNPQQFVGPSAMIATAYRRLDPLDQGDRVLEAVSNGIFHCIKCGNCDTVCPQSEIEHVKSWEEFMAEAEARGLKPSYAL
jgi:succinate dehydrogenase/fumarate reductase iron-sulfur protein